ncbi:MAG TPA: ABC transporter substrate-binding protein, partial [Sphingomonadaceae bacterium]|nr:ABC transporter substrate-binding protein [Sphingomonadaceae bacterium]
MRRFLALLGLMLLAACSRPLPDGVTELTYATPYPPSHPFSRADQRWIDFVESRSGGGLKIRPIWSGALLSSDMSMEELRHGVADIGLITP